MSRDSNCDGTPRGLRDAQMKPVLTSVVLLSACATTSTLPAEREEPAGSPVHIDLVPHGDATRTFPAVIAARLPTADRMAT